MNEMTKLLRITWYSLYPTSIFLIRTWNVWSTGSVYCTCVFCWIDFNGILAQSTFLRFCTFYLNLDYDSAECTIHIIFNMIQLPICCGYLWLLTLLYCYFRQSFHRKLHIEMCVYVCVLLYHVAKRINECLNEKSNQIKQQRSKSVDPIRFNSIRLNLIRLDLTRQLYIFCTYI